MQFLASCEPDDVIWLPSSPFFAPDAVVHVWRAAGSAGGAEQVGEDEDALN